MSKMAFRGLLSAGFSVQKAAMGSDSDEAPKKAKRRIIRRNKNKDDSGFLTNEKRLVLV